MQHDEALVVEAFCHWRRADGWATRTEQDFVDIVAERGGERLYAETKGATSDPGLDIDTAFGQLLRRMHDVHRPNIRYALVIADEPRSVRAVTRVAQRILDLLDIDIYAVTREGAVRELPGRQKG